MFFLLRYWDYASFPDVWQTRMNRVFVIQCAILMAFCVFRRDGASKGRVGSGSRWVPCPNAPADHWIFRQFKVMLLAHVIFYVLELSLTSMLRVYTVVGVHHILGIMIAGGLVLDPNGICFIVGIPFFLHTLYWALDGQFFFLLIFYNFSMLLGASYGFITTEGLDFAARPVKYATVICVSCISLFFNNYFMYCHGLMGEYCLTVDPLRLFGVTGGDELDVVVNNLGVKSNQGPYRGALFWAMLWYICWMAVLIVWASRMKEVWRKNPPSFAVTQPYHQLDTDCEAALIEDKQI